MSGAINKEIQAYNDSQAEEERAVCDLLAAAINRNLPEAECRIWHGHPVWFLEGNPAAGYSKQKKGVRLMFWSGLSFDEEKLNIKGGKFKDASIFYQKASEVNTEDLIRWLDKARHIQWDYKNLVKRKGVLERLK